MTHSNGTRYEIVCEANGPGNPLYRVGNFPSVAAAERARDGIVALGGCTAEHRIEPKSATS